MKIKKAKSAGLILACIAATGLTGCGKTDETSKKHEAITFMAPYLDVDSFIEEVHKTYPEVNLEVITYSGSNTTTYLQNMLEADDLPDICTQTFYKPDVVDVSDKMIDLSGYDFTDNYVESRLKEVSDDGALYMLPSLYNCYGITYNKTLLEQHGWKLPTSFTELEELAGKAKEAGVTAFVSKPLFMSELRAALTQKAVGTEKAAAVEKKHYNHAGKRVLLVEDNELNREIAAAIMEEAGLIVDSVEDGTDAVERMGSAEESRYDAILMDIVMPKMDGFDVLTYMNKNHWIEDIPVIMMSGADAPEAVKRAYALGAVDFVSKPCDAQIVYQRVTNTMKLYAKQRRLTSLITAQINEKEKNSEMLIHILSHIVEFRNGESGSHVLHIHKLTEMLLERLAQKTEKYHLDGDTRAMIALASSLHDIGKIGVDEKILNKPGKLTKEEFEIMKTHTVIGAEMLEQLGIYQNEPLVKIAHQICRWHHERYDGKGYPDGLVGDEIPISAQVVSVADVYDALASERVYKKAVPHEKVLEMILHGECGQFNPILIECLQEISSRIRSECYDEEQET